MSRVVFYFTVALAALVALFVSAMNVDRVEVELAFLRIAAPLGLHSRGLRRRLAVAELTHREKQALKHHDEVGDGMFDRPAGQEPTNWSESPCRQLIAMFLQRIAVRPCGDYQYVTQPRHCRLPSVWCRKQCFARLNKYTARVASDSPASSSLINPSQTRSYCITVTIPPRCRLPKLSFKHDIKWLPAASRRELSQESRSSTLIVQAAQRSMPEPTAMIWHSTP